MTSFDDIFLEDAGLVELQKAMQDPTVAKAVEEARIRAAIKNLDTEGFSDDYLPVDENTEELDKLVGYLINTNVSIDGVVAIQDEQGDTVRIIGDDMTAEFQGFVADVRDGKLEYKYFFQVYVTKTAEETWRSLTRDELVSYSDNDEEESVFTQTIAVSFESVHLSFDILHPVQALSWLSFEYPEIVMKIDEILFGSGNMSAEKQLLGLKNFTVTLPIGTPQSEVDMLTKSMREYVFTLILPDTDIAYGVGIDGDIIPILEDGSRGPAVPEQKSSMFSLICLTVEPTLLPTEPELNQTSREYGFALRGILHEFDSDLPDRQAIVPLRSFTDITSLRSLYLATLNTGENS
ncbi:MAG: hypothetical protein ACOH18_02160 [Candidatus Saccharimonadaceae bacterium]